MSTRNTCDYCGLAFSGSGYSPDSKQRFCCYGCYLVQRIMGSGGEEGIQAAIVVRLGLGAFLAMNVMMISLLLYTSPPSELGEATLRGWRWVLLLLATPAVAILGGPYVLGAYRDLRRKRISTDALILTGSLTAYGVGAVHVIRDHGHIYFDTATMLLVIVTIGRLLEASAKSKTSRAIRDVMEMLPRTARVNRDEHEIEIPVSEVVIGDKIVVKPGESIAADGVIISGECMVEEAAFTGEAKPRSCSPGDKVHGGSIDCDGLITVEATAVGADSLLGQVQKMVKQAQEERAPVERMVEKVSTVFVPTIWSIAILTGVYWGLFRGDTERAGMSALAVMVVACPCALGLATPMATCLAIGRAAKAGVLIRSGEILERLPRITRIFFDKTGTLTENRLQISEVRTASPETTPDIALAWGSTLEAGSEHIIAHSIVREARKRGINAGEVSDLHVVPGQGLRGLVCLNGDTKRVTAGSLKLLIEEHSLPDSLQSIDELDPLTITYLGWDGEIKAAVCLSDNLRQDSREVISSICKANIRTAIISGDRQGPCLRVARELEIGDCYCGCSPSDKAQRVRDSRKNSRETVAVVGDGINDAPALAQADVGIAVGSGTDLAREVSDLTLLGDDLARIPWVIDLARKTYSIIRWNLLWAFGYNSIAVILACLGYVHPLIAASAMVVSSISVVGSSMRVLK